MPKRGRCGALALTPGSERMRQLRDGEDALPPVVLHLLLRHATQQTEVILSYGLVVTPLAELTNLAVLVEDERWWYDRFGHLLHIPQALFCLP